MSAIREEGKRNLYIVKEIDSKGKVLKECGHACMMFFEGIENQQLLVFSNSVLPASSSSTNNTTMQAVSCCTSEHQENKTLKIDNSRIVNCSECDISFVQYSGKVSTPLMFAQKLDPKETFQKKSAHAVVLIDGEKTVDVKFKLDKHGKLKFKSKIKFDLEKANGAPIVWTDVGSGAKYDQVIGLLCYNNDQLHPLFFEVDTFTKSK